MPRELFPFEPDRDVIRSFLAGDGALKTRSAAIDTSLYIDKRMLVGGGSDFKFLWFDSADALTTVVEGPIHKHIANYVLEQVGASERITVEVHDVIGEDENNKHRVRYYFGSVPADEAPFVLVGPMTLMAWRAENGFKLRRK